MTSSAGAATSVGRLLGWSAVALSLGFIGLELWRDAPWHLAAEHLRPLIAGVGIGALVYGLAGFLLSTAWHQLLGPGISPAPKRAHHAIYGRTQIAKYLPGNLFHFVGRQIMGRRLGYPQSRLAFASFLETALLMLIAGGLALPFVWRWLDQTLLWALGVAGLALVLPALWPLRSKLHSSVSGPAEDTELSRYDATPPIALRLVRAGLLYAAFFVVVGAILWLLSLIVTSHQPRSIPFATSISVVALAWVAGFVTPGSSAGIGVREAVLIVTLEGSLGVPASTLVAMALRLVSVGGDGVFYAIGMTISSSTGLTKSADIEDGLA